MERTKEYERVEIDVIHLKNSDVITTSQATGEPNGDEDSFGWA